MSRWRPRYPARMIRPPLICPSGLQRFATEQLARNAIPVFDLTGLTPRPCGRCGGWHATPQPTERTD